jgi:transcriptional regulator
MHVPHGFHTDRTASLAFAADRGFGLVVACDGLRPVASPLPFRLDYAGDGGARVGFHVARGNRLADLAANGGTWLVAVSGADAYVSSDWYASPDQVPTWLYEAVHLSGPVRVLIADERRVHLDRLAETFEGRLAPKRPWTADKMTLARREAMMKAIVGIEMTVETVEGSRKLHQHKSDADHLAVTRALAARSDPGARTIAARMAALRPHLDDGRAPPGE